MRYGRAATALFTIVTVAAVHLVGIAGTAHAQPLCDEPDPPPACSEDDPPHDPEGVLVDAHRVPNGIQVSGWAIDPLASPAVVDIRVGAAIVGTLTANQAGPDGARENFSGVVPAVAGDAVCATIRGSGGRPATPAGCLPVEIGFAPYGQLEVVRLAGEHVDISGWAIDPDTAGELIIEVFHDGELAHIGPTGVVRPDVAEAHFGYGPIHGFALQVVARADGEHTVCVRARPVPDDGEPVAELGCRSYVVRHNPTGSLDEVTRTGRSLRIRGTASDPDEPATPLEVTATVDGRVVARLSAENGSFDTVVAAPGEPGERTVCAYARNVGPGSVNTELGCRTYTVPPALARPKLWYEPHSDRMEISWRTEAASNVTATRLEMAIGGQWTVLSTYPTGQARHTVGDLVPHTNYCFRVVAVGDFTETTSRASCQLTLYAALPAVTDVHVRVVSSAEVWLDWTDNTSLELGYQIFITDLASGYRFERHAAPDPTTGPRTLRLDGVEPGRDHTVTIVTLNPDYDTPPSGPYPFRTAVLPTITFTADPGWVEACTQQTLELHYTVTDATTVEIRSNTAGHIHTSTRAHDGVLTGSVTVAVNGREATFELVAYDEGRGFSTQQLVVPRQSHQYPFGSRVIYQNWSAAHRYLWLYAVDGSPVRQVGVAPPGGSTETHLNDCDLYRVVVLDQAGDVVYDYGVIRGDFWGPSRLNPPWT